MVGLSGTWKRLLVEQEFLRKLHRIREELARESRKQAFEELKAVRDKYRNRLGRLYIESKK